MKKVFIALVALVALSVSGCDEWTTPESLGSTDAVNRSTASSAELKSYKRSDHKIVIAYIQTASRITERYQTLMALPDSLDFACIKNPVGASASLKSEIKEVYDKKGTRTLCFIDFMSIAEAWADMIPVGEADNRTLEEFQEYCKTETSKQLACVTEYGYHGIVISYLGAIELDQNGATEFLEVVKSWRTKHTNALMFFRGSFWNLSDQTILADCDYIVISITTIGPYSSPTSTIDQMNSGLRDNINKAPGVPLDRFIWETVMKPTADTSPTGVQIADATQWVMSPLTGTHLFTKAGLAVDNAWIDYYYGMNFIVDSAGNKVGAVENVIHPSNGTYQRIRDAISVFGNYFEIPSK